VGNLCWHDGYLGFFPSLITVTPSKSPHCIPWPDEGAGVS